MTTEVVATSGTTFMADTPPVPSDEDLENVSRFYPGRWFDDGTDPELGYYADIVTFGTDLIDSTAVDDAIAMAVANDWALCDDQDSCQFFFDGYAIKASWTNVQDLALNAANADNDWAFDKDDKGPFQFHRSKFGYGKVDGNTAES